MGCVDVDAFLVECLAWGFLRAYGVEKPPVPVREMIRRPIPVFERLTLLELNLGLYDATYKLLLDGSRLIAVDLGKPRVIQRVGMARELYVAFCHSSRAAELGWTYGEKPSAYGDLFARCLLMPAVWVRRYYTEAVSMESLAALFAVPAWVMAHRLEEIKGQTTSPLVQVA